MDKLENYQRITNIKMMPIAFTKCKIGQDWYKNELEIEMVPGESYPDYMQINDFISRKIDGLEFNIEDVVNIVYEKIKDEFSPQYLKVTDVIKGCKTHFDVVVTKE